MCTEPHHHSGSVPAPAIWPETVGPPADPITLNPLDAVALTTLVDNSTDLLLVDQWPVRRHVGRRVSCRRRTAGGDHDRPASP
jgi:hypothetical protein